MAQVPSNLIPTKISQLPIDPNPSLDSWVMVNNGGRTYQVQLGNLIAAAAVPPTRQVLAGPGLTGGGALSSDVTLAFDADSVAITGGAIDGTVLGGTTPAAVRATTLSASGAVTLPASTSSRVPCT